MQSPTSLFPCVDFGVAMVSQNGGLEVIPRKQRAHAVCGSLRKTDNALPTTFSQMINCLFIWRCPGRSATENWKRCFTPPANTFGKQTKNHTFCTWNVFKRAPSQWPPSHYRPGEEGRECRPGKASCLKLCLNATQLYLRAFYFEKQILFLKLVDPEEQAQELGQEISSGFRPHVGLELRKPCFLFPDFCEAQWVTFYQWLLSTSQGSSGGHKRQETLAAALSSLENDQDKNLKNQLPWSILYSVCPVSVYLSISCHRAYLEALLKAASGQSL